jgi:hypothetical protein
VGPNQQSQQATIPDPDQESGCGVGAEDSNTYKEPLIGDDVCAYAVGWIKGTATAATTTAATDNLSESDFRCI